jgi:hypothetical protein
MRPECEGGSHPPIGSSLRKARVGRPEVRAKYRQAQKRPARPSPSAKASRLGLGASLELQFSFSCKGKWDLSCLFTDLVCNVPPDAKESYLPARQQDGMRKHVARGSVRSLMASAPVGNRFSAAYRSVPLVAWQARRQCSWAPWARTRRRPGVGGRSRSGRRPCGSRPSPGPFVAAGRPLPCAQPVRGQVCQGRLVSMVDRFHHLPQRPGSPTFGRCGAG